MLFAAGFLLKAMKCTLEKAFLKTAVGILGQRAGLWRDGRQEMWVVPGVQPSSDCQTPVYLEVHVF